MKDKKKNYSPCSCIMKLVETNQENQTKKKQQQNTHTLIEYWYMCCKT